MNASQHVKQMSDMQKVNQKLAKQHDVGNLKHLAIYATINQLTSIVCIYFIMCEPRN